MASNTSIKPLTGNAGDFSGIVLTAAARGDSTAVKCYLKTNPAWLNMEGPHGRTLLWEATYKGRIELVAELIEMGADVNPMGSYYRPMFVELSALAVARAADRTELVALLEQHGATDDLYAACFRGDLESINHFLTDDPEAINRPAKNEPPHPRMGYHPIHYAVVGKHLGAVSLLIGYGANVSDHLPLLIDWADGDRNIIKLLRQHQGPKPTTRKKTNNIPAIDRPDWMGFPLLVDACRGNHNAPDDPSRVQRLLDRGANVNIRDHKGKTPLHRSSQAGFVEITTLLLSHGADLEAIDAKGCTPLFDAAQHGRRRLDELLIEHGANLHHTEERGETALFAAARGGHSEVFEYLVSVGSDVQHRNQKNKSISEIISRSRSRNAGRERILQLLTQTHH